VWPHTGSARRRAREADACVHEALDIACWQRATSRAQRAAMNLTRRWQQQGKRTEVRQLLAELDNWLTEGLDPRDCWDRVDVQEARASVSELSCEQPCR
jgi:hypothetical protein